MGSLVTRVMGFHPANFQLATPFRSRLRVRHRTDMPGMGSRQFCRGRGEARQQCRLPRRGKAEAESSRPRRGRLHSRQGRGEATPPPWKTLFPLDVAYSSAKFGRFKSNCMTEGKWPRGPALSGCDLCHSSVWGFTGFKLELLKLHGRTLS